MSTTFDFGDHVVLVTGASGSLGTTTVDAFHEGGATVCLTARHRPETDDIALDSDRLASTKAILRTKPAPHESSTTSLPTTVSSTYS